MGREGTLGGTEDSIAGLETEARRTFTGGNGEDGARELDTRDPWQRRLVLVYALDLEEIKEVEAGGVDLDQVFVGGGRGGRQVGYFEVEGALMVLMAPGVVECSIP